MQQSLYMFVFVDGLQNYKFNHLYDCLIYSKLNIILFILFLNFTNQNVSEFILLLQFIYYLKISRSSTIFDFLLIEYNYS